jgi:hypothetical protein
MKKQLEFNPLQHGWHFPNCTSTHTTYDVLRNGNDNFAVKPTYVDPVYVDLAGVRTGLPRERVIATPAATRRR